MVLPCKAAIWKRYKAADASGGGGATTWCRSRCAWLFGAAEGNRA
jgi:hypothetical protein